MQRVPLGVHPWLYMFAICQERWESPTAGAGSCLHGQPLAPGLCQPSNLAEAVMNTYRILCTFYPNLDAISDVKDVALGQSLPSPPPSVAACPWQTLTWLREQPRVSITHNRG